MTWESNFKSHETIQTLTYEYLEQMRIAQFKYMSGYLATCADSFSDSDIDPVPSGLDLASMLMQNTYHDYPFTIDQLRHHVSYICCEAPCDLIFAMLFDDDDHLHTFTDRDMPDTWDCVNPETIT